MHMHTQANKGNSTEWAGAEGSLSAFTVGLPLWESPQGTAESEAPIRSGVKKVPCLAGAGAWQESSAGTWKLKKKHTSWFQAEVLVYDFLFLLSPSFFSLLFEECLCCYLWQARNTHMLFC